MERRSRCAEMKERRSSPCTDGGMRVPEFERSCAAVERELGGEVVAAETAEARRE